MSTETLDKVVGPLGTHKEDYLFRGTWKQCLEWMLDEAGLADNHESEYHLARPVDHDAIEDAWYYRRDFEEWEIDQIGRELFGVYSGSDQ